MGTGRSGNERGRGESIARVLLQRAWRAAHRLRGEAEPIVPCRQPLVTASPRSSQSGSDTPTPLRRLGCTIIASRNTHGCRPLAPFACSLLALALSGTGAAHTADTAPATPEIFAPGTISGPSGVDCPTFAPDGNTVYFDQQAHWNGSIMESHRIGDSWSAPQIAPFSGQWQNHDPAMAPDGSFLVYTSNRADTAGEPALHGGRLWRVDRRGDGWGEPVNHYEPWGSHLGPDGRTLYFTSNYTAKAGYPRAPAQAREDLARLRAWDNGNNHIWRLSLAPWLAARAVP